MKRNYLHPEVELMEFVVKTNCMSGLGFLDAIFGNSSDPIEGEEEAVKKPDGML